MIRAPKAALVVVRGDVVVRVVAVAAVVVVAAVVAAVVLGVGEQVPGGGLTSV